MPTYSPYEIIRDVTEALEGSVPRRDHIEVLNALKRCQEMIGSLANVIVKLDKEQFFNELMLEAKLYANILGGFFDGPGRDFIDIKDNFDPREYLKDKGVIKQPLMVPITVESKEDYIARLRKEHQDSIERAARLKRRQAMQEIGDKIAADLGIIQPAPASKKKRGRPIGSKNKSKDVLVLPTFEESAGKKVGILKRIKKAQTASTKKGSRK
jgi:hypothetical protein